MYHTISCCFSLFFLYHLIDKKKYAQGIPGSDQFSGTLEPDKGTWDQASPDPRCPDLLLTVSPVPVVVDPTLLARYFASPHWLRPADFGIRVVCDWRKSRKKQRNLVNTAEINFGLSSNEVENVIPEPIKGKSRIWPCLTNERPDIRQ